MRRQLLWVATAFVFASSQLAAVAAETVDVGLPNGTLPIKAEPSVAPDRWVLASDIPRSEWGQASVTTFDLTIDERGRPMKCSIVIPSGSENLDDSLCAAIMKRARFEAARDGLGEVLPSVRRDRVSWRPDLSSGNSWSEEADYVIATARSIPLRSSQ
jgi:hypothetical protein